MTRRGSLGAGRLAATAGAPASSALPGRRVTVASGSLALVAVALLVALAILLDAVALVIWDVGTRSPVRLAAEIRAGLRDRAVALRGTIRFALGLAALGGAGSIVAALVARQLDFTILESWSLVTALLIEQLVGPDLRAALAGAGKRRPAGRPTDPT